MQTNQQHTEQAPSDSEIATWQFDVRNNCHLTPEIMTERIRRAQKLPDSDDRVLLLFELGESLKKSREYKWE